MLEINQEASNHCFKSAAPIVRRPGGPGGTPQLATMSRCQVGATLDAHTGSMRPAACFANVVSPLIHLLRLQTHPPLL